MNKKKRKTYCLNNKKIFFICLLFVLCNIGSYYVGSHSFLFGYELNDDGTDRGPSVWVYNTSEQLAKERRLCNLMTEMTHAYWQHYDYIVDENDSIISKHHFFDTVIKPSVGFQEADQLREGDWEDFFFDWSYNADGITYIKHYGMD